MASLRLNLNVDNQFGRLSTLQSAASTSVSVGFECGFSSYLSSSFRTLRYSLRSMKQRNCSQMQFSSLSICAAIQPLDLTEDNVRRVLADARTELAQIFDTSVGITGEAELVEVDGPFVKISLRGRFWHERSMVLARLGNYLRQRIPEILEVDIEDEKQLDDSPENF